MVNNNPVINAAERCDGTPVSLIAFDNGSAMAERVADLVTAHMARAIATSGQCTLMASGGSTPLGLYTALSKRELDWAKVNVGLVDERWVAPGMSGSNETFVRESLLTGPVSDATFAGMYSDLATPALGTGEAEARLRPFGRFDVVVLGMGNDGHTASWFPHADGLDDALGRNAQQVCAIRAQKSSVTGDHLDRMTLSLNGVRHAGLVVLLLSGPEKRNTFEKACADGPAADMPVRAILRARPDLWVCWSP